MRGRERERGEKEHAASQLWEPEACVSTYSGLVNWCSELWQTNKRPNVQASQFEIGRLVDAISDALKDNTDMTVRNNHVHCHKSQDRGFESRQRYPMASILCSANINF
jgi:hypothetical protein